MSQEPPPTTELQTLVEDVTNTLTKLPYAECVIPYTVGVSKAHIHIFSGKTEFKITIEQLPPLKK